MLTLLKDNPRIAAAVWWLIIGGPIGIAVTTGVASESGFERTLTTFTIGLCIYAAFVGIAVMQPPFKVWTVAAVIALSAVAGATGAAMLSFARSLPLDEAVTTSTTSPASTSSTTSPTSTTQSP